MRTLPDQAQTLYEIVRERRSVRRYADRPVERALVQRLLEAATRAPSAHNRQPWRFAIIEDEGTRARLADAMNVVLRADLAADGLPAEEIEAQAARRRARLTRAPLLILLCMTMADMDPYPDQKRQRAEWIMACFMVTSEILVWERPKSKVMPATIKNTLSARSSRKAPSAVGPTSIWLLER